MSRVTDMSDMFWGRDIIRYMDVSLPNSHAHHRELMRDALKDEPMFFNGRWIIPCAVVAGGKKGGVTRDNYTEVCHASPACHFPLRTLDAPVLNLVILGAHRVRTIPRL